MRIIEPVNDQMQAKARACIAGFNVEFSNEDDHNLGQFQIQIHKITVQQNIVQVEVQYLLRDFSGTIDNPYDGKVDILVIVDRS